MVGHSDMHRANASFWFGGELPYRRTPFYDMLPMLYAPVAVKRFGQSNPWSRTGSHGDAGKLRGHGARLRIRDLTRNRRVSKADYRTGA